MYIWKIEPLIDELKLGEVSQKDQFKYALAFSLLTAIASDPLLTVGIEYTSMDSISSVIMLIVTIVGLWFCYRVNENADNKDFILRFFTLGLPISIRFIAIFTPITVVAVGLETFLDPNYDLDAENSVTTIYQVGLYLVAEIAFYIYFASKLRHFAIPQNA